jgi:hypothetical protein
MDPPHCYKKPQNLPPFLSFSFFSIEKKQLSLPRPSFCLQDFGLPDAFHDDVLPSVLLVGLIGSGE